MFEAIMKSLLIYVVQISVYMIILPLLYLLYQFDKSAYIFSDYYFCALFYTVLHALNFVDSILVWVSKMPMYFLPLPASSRVYVFSFTKLFCLMFCFK